MRRACVQAALLSLSCCQLASGLSDLHGEENPRRTSSEQGGCSKDRDCQSSKPRCLNSSCVEQTIADQWICDDEGRLKPSSVRYSFRVLGFDSRMPPKHVEAKACRSQDVECEAPVDEHTYDDQIGNVEFDLPTGFIGYFEITSEYLPALLYVTKPIFVSTKNRDLPLLSPEAIDATAKLAGVEIEPDTGLVDIDAIDCSRAPAGGIDFKAQDVDAIRLHFMNMLPDTKAELTIYDPDNNTADAFFVNVPETFVTFSAHLGVDGLQLQKFNAMVRANWVTFIDMMF